PHRRPPAGPGRPGRLPRHGLPGRDHHGHPPEAAGSPPRGRVRHRLPHTAGRSPARLRGAGDHRDLQRRRCQPAGLQDGGGAPGGRARRRRRCPRRCGTQCTGGNFTDWHLVKSWPNLGFPLIEARPDGTFTVTKHPGTGGLVSVHTVSEQLLYEMGSPRYLSPDCVARFDSVTLSQEGPDRVTVSGVRGEPPPDTLKVSVSLSEGYRALGRLIVSGPDSLTKAQAVADILWDCVGGRDSYDDAATGFFAWNACHRALTDTEPSELMVQVAVRPGRGQDQQPVRPADRPPGAWFRARDHHAVRPGATPGLGGHRLLAGLDHPVTGGRPGRSRRRRRGGAGRLAGRAPGRRLLRPGSGRGPDPAGRSSTAGAGPALPSVPGPLGR